MNIQSEFMCQNIEEGGQFEDARKGQLTPITNCSEGKLQKCIARSAASPGVRTEKVIFHSAPELIILVLDRELRNLLSAQGYPSSTPS